MNNIKKTIVKLINISLLVIISAALPLSCETPSQRPTSIFGTPKGYTHIVKYKGENLTIISKWYTGVFSNWIKIAKANSITKPKTLQLGDRIFIPQQLLITKKPMPPEYVGKFTAKQKKESPSDKDTVIIEQEQSIDDELTPFGPKE
ncbi:secreted protein [Candidatus Magnetoovum chiemensis]|nr:secreted protein [Candidatus Magnetoovum chiemensis]